MIRATLFVIFGAAVIAALLHVSIWITLAPIAAIWIYRYTAGGLKLRCPSCGKRVKLGYDTCHHCGRVVSARRAEPTAEPPRPTAGQTTQSPLGVQMSDENRASMREWIERTRKH